MKPSNDPPLSFFQGERRSVLEHELLVALRRDADALDALNKRMEGIAADGVYRFFHQSYKVQRLQEHTLAIRNALQALLPDVPINPWLDKVLVDGTERSFDMEHNSRWLEEKRPIIEAFLLAKHVLEMVCRYARAFDEPPSVFEPGWGTVLYLFMLR